MAGRTFVAADGRHNMPDGEFFTGPVEDSANGEVTYTYPAVYGGRKWSGVKLRFKDGKIVDASAERNEDFLIKTLDTDPGARRLGELGIGTNYGIDRFTKEILLDEKIGGTIHLAVGMSYPETGGTERLRRALGHGLRPAPGGPDHPWTARRSRSTASFAV